MKCTVRFRAGIALFVSAAVFCLGQSARADSIKITDPAGFSSPVSAASDGGPFAIDGFVITNTTTTNTKNSPAIDHTLEIESLTATIGAHSGNPDDLVTAIQIVSGGTCSVDMILAEGQSCTVDLILDLAGAPPSKPTGNYSKLTGTNTLKLTVDTTNPLTAGTANNTLTFDAAVDDAPEPGSLVLLGSGILGLALLVRRRTALN